MDEERMRLDKDLAELMAMAEVMGVKKTDKRHDKIAARVFRRLSFRYAQLRSLESQARHCKIHEDLERQATRLLSDTSQELSDHQTGSDRKGFITLPGTRAYHLAVTDLFVEKALAYLESRAERYQILGNVTNFVAFVTIVIGSGIAVYQMLFAEHKSVLGTNPGIDGFLTFTRSFTAYGMIVLIAVGLSRYGKAMLDQGERLLERRHALRQGRLFVHLNDGWLSLEQMKEAFNWNVSGENAFGKIPTEASAPWGAALKEFMHQVPELIKEGFKVVSSKVKKG